MTKMRRYLLFLSLILIWCSPISADDTVNDSIAVRLCKEAEDCLHGTNGAFLNKERAFELYQQAAGLNYAPACVKMAGFYYRGEVVEKNAKMYYFWHLKAAQLGSVDSQNMIGGCYTTGNGVEKDFTQARYWYEKAAANGSIYAMNNMRLMCVELKDTIGELKWTRIGAENGHVDCQINMGLFYDRGYGVREDVEQAEYWFKKAAAQNNADAYNRLSVLYHDKKKDFVKAFEYCKKAVELDASKVNLFNIGFLYENGHGVPVDYSMAEYYYKKAIEKNHDDARYYLGKMYYEGNAVVKKDKKKGKELLEEAARNGVEEAKVYLDNHKVKWSVTINGKEVLHNK